MKRLLETMESIDVSMSEGEAWRLVCDRCVADESLALFVSRSGPIDVCEFCGRHDRHCTSVISLFKYMHGCLTVEYDKPGNGVGWNGAEGGWLLAVMDSWDLLDELDQPLGHEELAELFAVSFDQQWCQRHPYS